MPMAYFGQPWDAPAIDDGIPVPTPIGQHCQYCSETVVEGDQGFLIPTARLADDGKTIVSADEPIHRECILLGVRGRPECAHGRCNCRDGRSPEGAASGPSIRDQARAAMAWVYEHGATAAPQAGNEAPPVSDE